MFFFARAKRDAKLGRRLSRITSANRISYPEYPIKHTPTHPLTQRARARARAHTHTHRRHARTHTKFNSVL